VAPVVVVFSLLLLQGSADAQSLCRPCRNAAQEESKKCLEAVISQEDKQWCQKKEGARVEACEHGECQLEKAQQAAQREALSHMKSSSDRESDIRSGALITYRNFKSSSVDMVSTFNGLTQQVIMF